MLTKLYIFFRMKDGLGKEIPEWVSSWRSMAFDLTIEFELTIEFHQKCQIIIEFENFVFKPTTLKPVTHWTSGV